MLHFKRIQKFCILKKIPIFKVLAFPLYVFIKAFVCLLSAYAFFYALKNSKKAFYVLAFIFFNFKKNL